MKKSEAYKRYESLDHTADIRMRLYGRTLRSLFQNAVTALTEILTDSRLIRKRTVRRISFKAETADLLLARLLREILFLFDARHFLSRRLEVKQIGDTMLEAMAWGERFSSRRHPLKMEIKGVTYHGLKVERKRGRWLAEVVLDV